MALNPLDRIQSYFDDLTKTDREIAFYIINNPQEAVTQPIDSLAKNIHTSKSALVRFTKRIGYKGFADFKFDLSRALFAQNAENTEYSESDSVVANITRIYSDYILKMQETCSDEAAANIAKMFLGANRVKLFGMNRSFNSANQMKQRLARMGFDAEAVSDVTTIQDIASIMGKDDLVIIFTTRDNTQGFGSVVKELHERECPVVCLTMSQMLPFRKFCTEYVVLPRISKDSRVSFLDDQAIFMVYIEILLEEIAKLSEKEKE